MARTTKATTSRSTRRTTPTTTPVEEPGTPTPAPDAAPPADDTSTEPEIHVPQVVQDIAATLPSPVVQVTDERSWRPVDPEVARSLFAERAHMGLRRGTDAPGSRIAWNAITNTQDGWRDAVGYAIAALTAEGYALCKREDV